MDQTSSLIRKTSAKFWAIRGTTKRIVCIFCQQSKFVQEGKISYTIKYRFKGGVYEILGGRNSEIGILLFLNCHHIMNRRCSKLSTS